MPARSAITEARNTATRGALTQARGALTQARGEVWSPLLLSPTLWLRGEQGAWADSVGGTPATPGGLVAAWEDLSGNGHHAVQATSANRPTWTANAICGHAVMNMTATNRFMTVPNAPALNPDTLTLFAVAQWPTNTGSWRVVVGKGDVNGGSTAGYMLQLAWTETGISARVRNSGQSLAPSSIRSVQVCVLHYNGSTLYYRGNGVSSTGTAVSGSVGDLGDPLGIGTLGTQYVRGYLAEVLLFNPCLGAGDLALVESYLATRYGGSLSG